MGNAPQTFRKNRATMRRAGFGELMFRRSQNIGVGYPALVRAELLMNGTGHP
jgi:hypothetical protein